MLKLFKRFKLKNWIFIFLILCLTVGQVFFTMQLVDEINEMTSLIMQSQVTPLDTTLIWKHGLYMIICSLLMTGLHIGIQFLASAVAADIVTRERNAVYEKINAMSMSDMNAFSLESLITRTTNDIQNVHLALLTAGRTIFLAPVTMIWSLIKLATSANSQALSIVTLVWLILLIAVVVILIALITPKFKQVQSLTDAINITSRENLTGVRVVRAFNAEKYQEDKFGKVNDNYTKAEIFIGRLIAIFQPFVIFVLLGLSLSLLWVSAFLVYGADPVAAAEIFASTNSFIMLASQIIMGFVMLIILIILLPRAIVSTKRINEVYDWEISIKDPEETVEFKEKGTIEFKNVGFAYPGTDKESVSNISFKVKQGQVIAFIGATGSGKTTIINMIPRLADATSGEVLVDGVNVKNVKQSDLRDRIGYTPQRGFLFTGTIKQNIAFSNPELSALEVKRAAEVADADSFVSKKSEQYDSPVAQGGTNFSGGQKQRLCIARSVAKRPEILIFDDSFSALDYKTDRLVRENIKKALPDTTRVIIAQRVGTILDADIIVVLDKGKIVGLGKHSELIHSCPIYQEIALSQLSKEELGL